jgi:N-acetylmuramoyl-L-alanine amidase
MVKIALGLALLGLALVVLAETRGWEELLHPRNAGAPRVGLVAGHWQNDSGAVCADGLQEAEVNLAVTRRVADLLRRQGVQVDVLPEFSPKLNNYRATAFLSIHADSCVGNLSGFKVARHSQSTQADTEDALVRALYQSYAEATGLKPHLNTVTDDMRQYHALRQIAPETPGAIIEIGFLSGDRLLLTQGQDRVAAGIANGLLAFLASVK